MQKAFNVVVRVFGFMMVVFWSVASMSPASAQSSLPSMVADFSPSTVFGGDMTSLTYTITSNDTVTTTDLAMSHTLPAGLTVGTGAVTSSCGPSTVTAAFGGSVITLANGFVERGVTCNFVVPIATSTTGNFITTTGDLTSSLGNSGPTTTNSLTVNAAPVTPLLLSQSVAPSAITIGAKSALTFTFDNTASAIAIGSFTFNDTLPTGMIIDADVTPTNTCVNANAGFPPTFTVDAAANTISLNASGFTFAGFEVLPAGASCQIVVPLVGGAEGIYANASDGALYNRSGATNLRTNTSSATLTVTGSPAGAPLMTKAFTDDPVDPGAEVSVRYIIKNKDRDFAATDLAFADDLDAALTGLVFSSLTSNTCGGVVAGTGTGQLSLAGGSVAAGGGSCVIVASVTAPSATAGSYPSPTGAVTAQINGSAVTGNAASDSLILRGAAAPTATVSFTDSAPNGTTTMSLVITNQSGTQALTDLSYATTFSGGFPIGSATTTPAAGACGAGSTFTFVPLSSNPASLSMSDGSLAAGASCTVTWVLDVLPDAPGNTYSNTSDAITATVGATPVTGGRTTGSLTVAGDVNLDFMTSFSNSVVPGGTVNVIFQLSNAPESAATATAINFTDDIEAMLSGTTVNIGAASNTCGGTLSEAFSVISFSAGSLAPGATCEISVPLTISASALNGKYTNTTTPMSATPSGGTAQNYGTASANLSVFSLTGTGAFNPSSVVAGETTTVTYTLTNNGADDVTDVTFNFNASNIHSGSTLAAAATVNTCGGAYSAGSSFGIYSGGTVSAGSSCVLEVLATTSASAPAGNKIMRTSNISGTVNGGAVAFDPVSATLNVADTTLNFGKVFGASNVPAGSIATLIFNVENTSASGAVSNLAFSDDLDGDFLTGATVLGQSANSCGGTLSGIGSGSLGYSGGSLAASATCSVAVTVQLPSGVSGTFQNTSSQATGTLNGFAIAASPAKATLTVTAGSPPTFTKSFTPDNIAPNSSTTISYTITNPAGGGILTGVQFSDAIGTAVTGATLTYGSTTGACGAGSALSGGSTLLLSGGTLAAGESCTFTATVSVPLIAGATFTSTTSDLRDNGLLVASAASDDLTITPPAPGFAQAVAPSSIAQGGMSTLTYTVDNTASADAAGSLSFSAGFPAGLAIAATPNAASTCGGMGNAVAGATSFAYAGGAIAAGATCTVQFDVTSQTVGAASIPAVILSSAAGPATATATVLTVTAAPAPDFAAVFSPTTISQGDTSTLTYTVDNSTALIAANGLDFTTSLPAGLVVSDTPNASTTCTGGTISSVSASGTIAYAGGTVAAATSCSIQVDVRATGFGSLTATSGDLTSSLGASGTAGSTLTVSAAPQPVFTAGFSPTSIVQGDTSTLTLTVNNSSAFVAATALDFTNTLPAGVTLAATPNAFTSCSTGTLTAAAGSGALTYSGGAVSAGDICLVRVDVTSRTVGAAINTSGDLTSSLGNSGTASDTLTVTTAPAPTFSALFSPDSIVQGGTSTLTFTVDNAAALIDVTALDFVNNLPAGVRVSSAPNTSSTCSGGTLTATAGAGSISYTAGTVPAGVSCAVQLDVTSATVSVAINTSGDLTSSQGNSGTASDTLSVTAAPAPAFTMSVAPTTIVQGAVSTVSFNVDNTGALISADTLGFDFTLPAGVDFAPTLNFATDCVGSAATPNASGVRLTATTLAAGAICSAQFDVTAVNAGSTVFTTGDLTSSLGNSGTANAVLSVTAAGVPNFSATFAPSSIVQGGISTLTFSIDNSPNLVAAQTGAFTNVFPAGMTVAATPNYAATCSGTSTVGTGSFAAGGNSLALSGIEVGASATCRYAIDVTTATDGPAVNTSGDLVTSLGNSGPAAAVLTVTGAPIPGFTAAYSPDTVVQGAGSVLTFTIDNASSLIDANDLGFATRLPVGVTVASPINAATTCGVGVIDATSGDGGFLFSVGTVAAGATCSVSVGVTATTAGIASETSGVLTTSLGATAQGATAALTVTGAPAPTFTGAYTPATMIQGDFTTLVYTISNASALVDATSIAFSETLPAGVSVASSPAITNDCGGTLTATAGSNAISYTAGTLAAGLDCAIRFDVTSVTVGDVTGVSGPLTSSLGDSGTATSALSVTGAAAPLFAKAFAPASVVQGAVSTLTFTIDNSAALVDATGLAFTDIMPGGMVVAAAPNVANSCTSGALTATAGSESITLAGASVPATSSCTISVDITRAAAGSVTNVTGDLTSSLGSSGTASDELITTAAAAPAFAKAFAPDTIVQGEVSTLTFSIDNTTALVDATAVAFSDNMPAGMVVAATPNASSTCDGGTITATAGSATITMADATVPAVADCMISVDVTLLTAGSATNVTGDLTSSLGNSGTATAVLTATGATAPSFAKAFSPDSIAQGKVSTLTFTIDNAAALVDTTALAFSDTFPAGMTIAPVMNASSTCAAGSLSAVAGASTVTYSGGTVGSGASCLVSVDVTATNVQSYANTSGALTSSLGNSGTATASLTVTAASAPDFSSFYAPPSIPQGGATRLSLKVDNGGAGVPATALGFMVTLPAGVTLDDTDAGAKTTGRPDASNTCGGTVTAVGGATTVSLSNASVAAGSTCTVSVNVTSQNIGTVGPVTGSLTSSLGGASVTSGTPLVVVPNLKGRVTFVQNASEDGTYTFSATEALLNFSIKTNGGSGSRGPIELDQGTYVVTQSRPAGVGNTAISCSDNDSAGDTSSGTLTLTVAANEAVTCTFSSIATAQRTTEVINSFLQRRNNLILSNGPTIGRRLARLSQGAGATETLSFQRGNLRSFSPVNFNLLTAGSGSYDISTSLYQIERSALMFALASDDIEGNTALFTPRRFDIWFEGHYGEFKASEGSNGHFGIGYLGADYLFTPDLLAGVMLQFDSLDDQSAITGSSISGQGWMVGPYVTARVAPNLIFDGRFAYGRSTNEVSPFNTYTDTFNTDRFLVDASLSGNFEWDRWVITPTLSTSYIQERQHGYTDALNVAIGSQTVSLGQTKFGPTFATTINGPNSAIIEPSFTLNGIYNYGSRNGPLITNDTADETNGLRARIEAAIKVTNRYGARFELGANYDGIGQDDFESWGANLKVTIPLQ